MAKTSSRSARRFTFAALGSAFLVQEAFVGPIMVTFYTCYIGLPFERMSLFFSIIVGAKLLLSFPLGYVADAMGRKRLLLVGQALAALSMATVFLLRFDPSIMLLLCIGLTWGAARAIDSVTFMPSLFYMARKCASDQDMNEILARRAGLGALLTGLAVILSGIVATRGVQYSFMIDIAIALIALLFFAAFLDESVGTKRSTPSPADRPGMLAPLRWSGGHYGILLQVMPVSTCSGIYLAMQRAAFNYLQPALALNAVPMTMWGVVSALLFFVSYLGGAHYKATDARRSDNSIVRLSCVGLAFAMAGSMASRSATFVVLYFLSSNLAAPMLLARSTRFVMHRLSSVDDLQSSYLALVAIMQTVIMATALTASGYLVPSHAYDQAVVIASAVTICCIHWLDSHCRK